MTLKMAVEDLRYLLNRGYRKRVALNFVANHYLLGKRERNYLARYVFSDETAKRRLSRLVSPDSLRGSTVQIDGYNVLIGTESVLEGSGFFIAQDGFLRDIKGVSGSYIMGEVTMRALNAIMDFLSDSCVEEVFFYFDRNVSHSGRLRQIVEDLMNSRKLEGRAILSSCVDRRLKESGGVVATADGAVIDSVERVIDIPHEILMRIKKPQKGQCQE
ncbi:MAG: DUF434 domain-containing protein [Methanothermobacter sp.]|uniref:DUF434 domain-containing protein n=2 Tax=Methanothermobacter sp. TaxID=1884223 RepID=UPI003C771311